MAENNNYSKLEIENMQKQAINRVKDMQERAKKRVSMGNSHFWKNQNIDNRKEIKPIIRSSILEDIESSSNKTLDSIKDKKVDILDEKEFGLKNIISTVMNLMEEDTILILMLIFVLSKEDGDNNLILALCYILI
ncbi:MAG: hypothetical protein KFW09_01550 [Oscillospiraceae bacterium]|nr:hypothetical protein [Oscillospiraceae bacterium]